MNNNIICQYYSPQVALRVARVTVTMTTGPMVDILGETQTVLVSVH